MKEAIYRHDDKELQKIPQINMLGMTEILDASQRSLEPHYNKGIEICILFKGRFEWRIEETSFLLYPNDCTVTLPWQKHGGVNGIMNAGKLMWLILTPEYFNRDGKMKLGKWSSIPAEEQIQIGKKLCQTEKPYFAADEYLKSLFFEIFSEIQSHRECHSWRINRLLDELLFHVTRKLINSPLKRKKSFDLTQLEFQIKADLQHKWTLSDLERITGYGKSRLSSIIRENTGVSPITYLTLLRLGKAKELLLKTDLSITDIAFECGFNSSQRFSTVFKKNIGKTPSEFRQTAL